MDLRLGLVRECPSDQTEIDVFRGEWSFKLPIEGSVSGEAAGFSAVRGFLLRCAVHFGSFRGFKVLELGPLEGEVTYALERMGPRKIVSIEGRTASYLKCLIAKNLFGLDRTRFMLGDFVRYLETTNDHFEFCCAQGVLYHMTDPVRVLQLIAQTSDRCFIGTHYYDDERLRGVARRGETICGIANPNWNLPEATAEREIPFNAHGFGCTYFKHLYNVTEQQQEAPDKHHHHGLSSYACFMKKDDIVRCLEHFGMEVVEVRDEPDAERGPYVGIIARKRVARLSRDRLDLLFLVRQASSLATRILRGAFQR